MEINDQNILRIKIAIHGQTISGCLFRHLSPRTFSSLKKALPLKAPSIKENGNISILANLDLQGDKFTNHVHLGDIIYRPRNGSVCIVLGDAIMKERVVPLGRVEDQQIIDCLDRSSVATISEEH
jgi:hypothetical protein